jgi:putative transposase
VLRAAVETHGAPEALVSDGGGVFRANQARAIYAWPASISRFSIPRAAWQSYIETHFDVMRRMADYHLIRAASWDELRGAHARFVHDYNH